MKKRVTALCLTAALVSGILAGCGGGAAKTTEAPAQTQAEPAKEEGTQAEGAKAETPAAELPKVNVKIGYELNPGEPAGPWRQRRKNSVGVRRDSQLGGGLISLQPAGQQVQSD